MHGPTCFALALISLALTGCPLESKSCTAIGCSDGAFLTLAPGDAPWPEGSYAIELETPDAMHTCTITVPDDLPEQPGSVLTLPCEPQLSVSLMAEAVCTEQRSGDAISQSCTPVPDRWSLNATLEGTPDSLHVRVARDGAQVLEETLALDYEESRPNGPDCDPLCRQAHVELTLR